MPEYEITSEAYPRFSVRIGECTRKHADSVFDQLLVEPTAPSDLTITELAPRKRSGIWRLLRRNRG